VVFSSITFLFYFFPVVIILYFSTPKKFRNLTLFLVSLIFYSWGEPTYIWIMLFSVIVDFTCGKNIDKNIKLDNMSKSKLWLILSIVINLSLLGFFKYGDFLITSINSAANVNIPLLELALPIGISFYTFQTMSYTIDVYRRKATMQKDIIAFGAYVTLFPQLIAGPIVRYKTIASELLNRKESYSMISEGIKRFIIGLGKKVLLANNIGLLWETVSKIGPSAIPLLTAWLGIIAFAFQIYFDFSGYSDMAIGLGKIFGFNFLENFNYPYMAKSITDFWRRWHISLGTWFKEYVYFPLGGNRQGLIKQARNIFVVWFLTGLWHGASWNFVIWGMYFGVLLLIEKLLISKLLIQMPKILQSAYTLILVFISWAIFAFDSFHQGIIYIKAMFNTTNGLYNSTSVYLFSTNLVLLIILTFASTDYPKTIWQKLLSSYKNSALMWRAENVYLVLILIVSVSYLVDQSYNPFLYFRF